MSELYLRVFTREEGERMISFEVDFDDFPGFDPEDETHLTALENEITAFLEQHFA